MTPAPESPPRPGGAQQHLPRSGDRSPLGPQSLASSAETVPFSGGLRLSFGAMAAVLPTQPGETELLLQQQSYKTMSRISPVTLVEDELVSLSSFKSRLTLLS